MVPQEIVSVLSWLGMAFGLALFAFMMAAVFGRWFGAWLEGALWS